MDTIQPSDWLNFALILWVLISLCAAPLVGRFVAGVLSERTDDARRATSARTMGDETPQTAPVPRFQAGHNGP